MDSPLVPGRDFYINEQGLMVLTAAYHLARGYCCHNSCLQCPYGYRRRKLEEAAALR
jgi:hypothetical protein